MKLHLKNCIYSKKLCNAMNGVSAESHIFLKRAVADRKIRVFQQPVKTVCTGAVASAAEYLRNLIASSLDRFLAIVPATADQVSDILSVQHAAFQKVAEQYGDLDIPPLKEKKDDLDAAFGSLMLLVAEWKGRIVGSVRLQQENDTGLAGRLSVLPAFQGLGIGRKLMVELEARAEGIRRFEIFTGALSTGTIRLYESLGYRIFREGEEKPGPDLVYMEKKTGPRCS